MTDGFDDRPPYAAAAVAVVAAAVSAGVTATAGGLAAAAALGVPLVALGAVRASRTVVTAGAVLLALGALLAGAVGAPVPVPLAGVAVAAVAWDAAEHGIGLGEQVGRSARSTHAVVAHTAATTLVAVGASLAAGVLYTVGPGGRPLTALLLLLVGAIVLAAALTD